MKSNVTLRTDESLVREAKIRVYANDSAAGSKHALAKSLGSALWQNRNTVEQALWHV